MKSIKFIAAALALSMLPMARAHADTPRPTSATTTRIPRAAPVSGSCNLNQADATQLAMLPGIGPVRARAIIAHRQQKPFRTVDELVKVKGIGRKTFAKLRPYLSVSGPTTLARAALAPR
jgi:competence protein ComEA